MAPPPERPQRAFLFTVPNKMLLSLITLQGISGHKQVSKENILNTVTVAGAFRMGNVFGHISCYQLGFPFFSPFLSHRKDPE